MAALPISSGSKIERNKARITMNDTDILRVFLNLPLGKSDEVFDKFARIPGAVRRGSGLEQFLFIEGDRPNRVMLVAHADTYWDEHYGGNGNKPQELIQQNGIVLNKNGGLGADNRAGCAIIWLLREMGHSILITNGEERGRTGSRWLMNENHDIADTINLGHQFVVQLDRRNAKDFKCYSVGTDKFRTYISQATGYSEPDRSSCTDIVTLCRDICGVNLSIGYHNEHGEDEHLVVSEWQNTLNICRKWLSESELPHFGLKKITPKNSPILSSADRLYP